MHLKKENNLLFIGDETIAPGEDKLVKISIDRLPTGTLIDIPLHVFNALEPGPVLLIQAGLHGDEINGVEIVRRMLHQNCFKIRKGAIIAVPVLNVYGFIHFSRDVPDGKDVNRSFPGNRKGSMASRMAYHYSTSILSQITHAIDLHTGGSLRHNFPQVRYTREDQKSKILAKIFNAPVFFSSRLIKGSFRKMAHDNNIPAIVYEAGESMRFDEYLIQEGIQGILNVMKFLEMAEIQTEISKEGYPTVELNERKWLRAPTAGMFIPDVTNGEEVEKGQTLGTVSAPYSKKGKLIKAPFKGHIFCVNHQAVVTQGDALFHLGRTV